ncbi:MAG TPA: ferritin family protein [Burkholderiaceae bacterium]|nr:ferritin family protein [Burkholderiaceae bacterium]
MSDVRNVQDLMAHAYAMELEASERYAEFSDVMVTHNNREVAELFSRLARIEQLHANQILAAMGWTQAPSAASGDYRWLGPERPETGDHTELHYLMTPWHALKIARANEERAHQFYGEVARTAASDEIRAAAREMETEEAEHVRLIDEWLAKTPRPDNDWAHDFDPPQYLD